MIRKRQVTRSLRMESLHQRRLTAAAPMPTDMAEWTDPPAEIFTPRSQTKSQSPFAFRGVLSAEFSQPEVREDSGGSITLTLTRNQENTSGDLLIRIRGGDPSQLAVPVSVIIPDAASQVSIRLSPVNDTRSEAPATLSYTFTAAGYAGTSTQIKLVDDEPPRFQNPQSQHDVNADGNVTALDALQVINSIRRVRSGGSESLLEAPINNYPDVNGDYQITAVDALQVINAIRRGR